MKAITYNSTSEIYLDFDKIAEIIEFPDGAKYVKLDTLSYLTSYNGKNIIIRFYINNYDDLFILSHLVDVINHNYSQQPTIFIPNLLDAQADDRFNSNESFGLKLVLTHLNNLNAKYIIFHPHNKRVVNMGLNNVSFIDNTKLISASLYDLYYDIKTINYPNLDNFINDDVIFLSTDAGGYKELTDSIQKLKYPLENVQMMGKTHIKGGGYKQIEPNFDFTNKHVVVIDDICVGGGTVKGISKLIKNKCKTLSLIVSHITIKDNKDPLTNYFDKVYSTNSKFDKYELEDENKLTLFKV